MLAVVIALQAGALAVVASRLRALGSKLEAHEQASAARHAAALSYTSRVDEERAAPLQ